MNIAINNALAVNVMRRLVGRLGDFSPVLSQFKDYHSAEVDSVFDRLQHGGSYRGLTWRPWPESALPHKRKRAAGQTLGRKRPSGNRVSASSKLNQDSGALRQDVRSGLAQRTKASLQYGTTLDYAPAVFKYRQPYSITAQDGAKLVELSAKALLQAMRGSS